LLPTNQRSVLHEPRNTGLVWADICGFISHPDEALERVCQALMRNANAQSKLRQRIDEERSRADQVQAALKKACWAHPDEVKSELESRECNAEHDQELASCRQEIARLEKLARGQRAIEIHLLQAEDLLCQLRRSVADDWTIEKKRRVVETLVKQITILPGEVAIDYWFR
jgi:hypothetical protein